MGWRCIHARSGRTNRQLLHLWETIHQQKSSSTIPDRDLITFTEQLRPQIPDNFPILDLGCGQGRNSRFLSQLGFNVCASDWSFSALKTVEAYPQPGKRPLYTTADLTCLPFPDNYFAAAICVHVLPYLLTAAHSCTVTSPNLSQPLNLPQKNLYILSRFIIE